MRNLQEKVKKAFGYQKLFWPFPVWINCSSDLKIFANSRPTASNFETFSWSLEQFFLTVGQNNFDNKIPLNLYIFSIQHYICIVGKNFKRKNVGISKFISFLVSSWYVFNSYEIFTINVESLIFHFPKMKGKKSNKEIFHSSQNSDKFPV